MKSLLRLLCRALPLAIALPCAAQLVETNVALNKPTTGDVAFNYPTSNGNDGVSVNFTHADNVNAAPNNPFWAVDLQGSFNLLRIEIVDRNSDACCDPNRLNGSEIRVFDGLGTQIGATMNVDGFPTNNVAATATLVFTNNGAGWPGAASIRVDGYQQYFQFAELRAVALQPAPPAQAVNVAPTGLARASGAVWTGTSPANLIDENPANFVHVLAQSGTLGFTYTIDLFASYAFERLEILNRQNCCPERLSNYRVSLHEEGAAGMPGPSVWTAVVRGDNTNSGQGGTDTVEAGLHPAGTFAGRFITIENLNDFEYSPQIAEVRALTFDAPPPNLATGKAISYYDATGIAVGAWGGLPATNIIDGRLSTISHPLAMVSAGYYAEIDLGAETAIGSVVLAGRLDGCCPDRLTSPTLEIRDGTSNTVFLQEIPGVVGEPVTIETGALNGRYIRVRNSNGDNYGPQISELRIYPPTGPVVPFQITDLVADPVTGNGTVTFTSRPGATYSLFGTSDLITWAELNDNVQSDGNLTVEDFHDLELIGKNTRYYQIRRP